MTWRSSLAMRWPTRWANRRRAKRRCEERQQSRYPGWTRCHDRSNGGLSRQLYRPQKPLQLSWFLAKKGPQEGEQNKTVRRSLFEQFTHQLAFRRSRPRWECQVCKQSMGETSPVRWLRAGPCAGEIQAMQNIGNSPGLGVQQVRAVAYVPIGWKIVHQSHSVAQYRGVT